MKIFGTTFPFVESGTSDNERLGRLVANYEFLKSLLNFSSFERFHLFCLSPSHAQNTINKLKTDDSISDNAKQKVEIFLYDSLKEQLQTTNYHCFHLGGWSYHFSGTVYLRNTYAKEAFPVTGIIHSLNATATSSYVQGLIRSNAQEYDSIFCTSNDGKEVMRKKIAAATDLDKSAKYDGKLSQIPLGYDFSLDNKMSKTAAKITMNFEQGVKYILYLGRLSPSTKADLYPLLLVFKSLKEKVNFKIKLVLAGGVNPNELRVHKEMIQELGLDMDVQLMINFDLAKKRALISSAEVCVAPSDNIQETFGISIIEAAACGIPVVAADIDGYKDLVVQNETGFKIKTTWIDDFEPCEIDDLYDFSVMQIMLSQAMAIDCDEMEEKIHLLLTDENLRNKMGENAAKRAVENYRWDVVIKRYEKEWDLLKEIAVKVGKPKEFMSNPYSNRYLETFSHYPTRTFNENLVLQITPDGESVIKRTKQIPQAYGDCSIMLDIDYLLKVMQYLSQRGQTSVKSVFMKFPDNRTKGRYSILWAVKYRLMRFVEA
ncbi:MAG: glycosyltransferase family 4 protein [Chitinispirillales bacterium]|jgi:glycosyltransferase involved in cell wall biosynthesis|nr:glycosyltransferase family 4 protein [Chitinispirillales bacterium]